ncbi:MAG: glycerol kinase [Alphaproteobacteria bacterium]|nr:glycerol kinase [Alphaproteobacteria bacterium]
MSDYILAVDQGTTSSRAIVFDKTLKPIATAQQEFPQHFPVPGFVEHDPEDIWNSVITTARAAIKKADISAKNIAAIGITNQRETTVLWDKTTGKPIYNAIVWQDRRTADACAAYRAQGYEAAINKKTGLLLDPYFSATKIAWILDHVDDARQAAQDNRLAFGTIDSFLLWRLTGGKVHATDATNASRTLLLNIHSGNWDDELLALFNIPRSILPLVRDSGFDFGTTDAELFGAPIPILGIAGDQQAAMIGQGCFTPGMMKATYGTGCFALMNTGQTPVLSKNKLLTTIAYQIDGVRSYALEGSIFMAGATVQWLRDGLKIIRDANEVNELAASADPAEQVYLVPAFVGLGVPWWDAEARGALFGLTRKSGAAEIARAALEAVGYQTRDLIDAMHADGAIKGEAILRVDGGMTRSDITMQFLADMLGAPVDRPNVIETTARGVAYLAGLKAGLMPDIKAFSASWQYEKRFLPTMPPAERDQKWNGWKEAVARTLTRN